MMSNFFTKAQNTGRETMSNAAAFAEGEIGTHQRMAWTPVIAGALTGLVAQLVLSLFGLGIGLSTAPGVKSFSIIAGIWLVLSAVVANGVGGFMAARVGGGIARSAAGYQGLVTWALTTVICLVLLTSAAGSVVGGAFGAITGAFGGAGSAISGAVKTVAPAATGSTDPIAAILGQAKALATDPSNAQAGSDTLAALRSAISSDPSERAQATDQAAQALAKARNVPVDQAKTQIETLERQYDQLKQQASATASKVADEASTTASGAALGASISLLLGALAAFFGGRFGAIGLAPRLVSAD
jgi:hypothetical protein